MDGGQTATITTPSGLKVFISYSREDMDFVDELELVLKDKGHEVLIDRHGISAGEEFRNRLEQMIRTCDTVVFVMTDDSLTSDACGWEIDLTKNKYNKRMLVVTLKDISDGVAVPDALAGIDWIHCWRNPRVKDSNPTKGFILLDTALRTDLAWVRRESLIYDDALQWIERGAVSDSPLLLSGELLTDAQAWAREAPDGHAVSPEVDQFIKASAQADARQKAEAEANIAEREKALEDARTAIAAREEEAERARAAIAEREKASARARRTAILAAAASGLFVVGSIIGAFVLMNLSATAKAERAKADLAIVEASEANRENAISRAQVIAEAAMNQMEAGDVESATRLAILSFQEGKEAGGVASANVALSLIAQEKRAVGFLSGHESPIEKYVPAAWDNLALTLTRNGVVQFWEGLVKGEKLVDDENAFSDAIFNNQTEQIITLQEQGTLVSWTYYSGWPRKLRVIETPESLRERTSKAPDPDDEQDDQQGKEIIEIATSLREMPKGGFAAGTSFGRIWLFGPTDEGGYISEAITIGIADSVRLSSDDLAVLIIRSSRGGTGEVTYEKIAYSDGSWTRELVEDEYDLNVRQVNVRKVPIWLLGESFLNSDYGWSADSKLAAAYDGSILRLVDIGEERSLETPFKIRGSKFKTAITPDNSMVAIWQDGAQEISLVSIENNAELAALSWIPVVPDFEEQVLESDPLDASLVLGSDILLRTVDRKSGYIIAGPLQIPPEELAGYTFANEGKTILARDFESNVYAFDGKSGFPLNISKKTESEFLVSQTDSDELTKVVDALCSNMAAHVGRTKLTPRDAEAVVLLKQHVGADVCSGKLSEEIRIKGDQFGTGELRLFASAFEKGIDFVIKWEGGYVDHPDDPGGRTNKGVTQNTYNKWRAKNGLLAEDVLHITDQEVHAIYLETNWQPVVQNWYPESLSIALFDTSVNMGPRRAISMLQHSINETLPGANIDVDGSAGVTTFDAVRDIMAEGDENKLLENYLKTRRGVYHGIVERRPHSAKYLNGWLNRLNDLARFVGATDYEFE